MDWVAPTIEGRVGRSSGLLMKTRLVSRPDLEPQPDLILEGEVGEPILFPSISHHEPHRTSLTRSNIGFPNAGTASASSLVRARSRRSEHISVAPC